MSRDAPCGDVRHVYVHYPFCASKCPYCDFNSHAGRDAEIDAYLNGFATEAENAGAWRQFRLFWRRNRVACNAVAVALVALGGVIVGVLYSARLQTSLDETEQARQIAVEANQRAEVADYYRRIALARAEWQDGNMARIEPLLDGCPGRMRQWEWHYLKSPCS